jgi:hypothetical protein
VSAGGLSGDALVADLWLDRAAVTNWARLTGGPGDLHDARFALLDLLSAGDSALAARWPDWMTSPKPGVDAWVSVGDQVTLALRHDLDSERTWRAINCLAPKRGRARKPASDGAQLTRPVLDDDTLARACAMGPAELADATLLSLHCLQRLAQRAGTALTDTLAGDLDAEIRRSGRMLARAPGWADGAGYGGPTLLCDWHGDTLAMPVAPNRRAQLSDPPRPLVATTCIAYGWAREDLPRSGPALADVVHISERAARAWLRSDGQPGRDPHEFSAALADAIARRGVAELDAGDHTAQRFGVSGPHLLVDDLCLKLRPASPAQRQQGIGWFVDVLLDPIT